MNTVGHSADVTCRLEQPIAVEANKRLADICSNVESLLGMLEDCIKRPNGNQLKWHTASDSTITVTNFYVQSDTILNSQNSVTVQYKYSEGRQGFGQWIAQVQSRSAGGEGGGLFLCCCSLHNSYLVLSMHFPCDVRPQCFVKSCHKSYILKLHSGDILPVCTGDTKIAAQVTAHDFSMTSNRQQLISAPIANRQLLTVESSQAPEQGGKRTWVRKLQSTTQLCPCHAVSV